MIEFAENYFNDLLSYALRIRVTDRDCIEFNYAQGIERAIDFIEARKGTAKKVLFIGNGGSAAISSHMAVDFWKNGGIKAVSFNDGPQLTCLGNDYGYQYVFEKPIAMFAEPGDLLFAISSSGSSENILLGAQTAREKGCSIITLSGFDKDNPLSLAGDLNFHVPSSSYGTVEVIHHSICHCILDSLMKRKNG